jgi:hypothetical protein
MLRAAALALALSFVLVAAGCGGSDDEASPSAAWASGFCTAVVDWTDSLQEVTSQFTDPSELSVDAFRSAADDAKDATEQLVDDLRALGAPETESGVEIQSSVDLLSSTLETETAEIETAVDGIEGFADLSTAIPTVTASLSAMGTAFANALQSIESADVGGELESALEDSPECAGIPS